MALVTCRYTMDKQDSTIRHYLADRADLIGAIRLPNTTFKANAGTEVKTDILFLQKRPPGAPTSGETWLDLAPIETPDGERIGMFECSNSMADVDLPRWARIRPSRAVTAPGCSGTRLSSGDCAARAGRLEATAISLSAGASLVSFTPRA